MSVLCSPSRWFILLLLFKDVYSFNEVCTFAIPTEIVLVIADPPLYAYFGYPGNYNALYITRFVNNFILDHVKAQTNTRLVLVGFSGDRADFLPFAGFTDDTAQLYAAVDYWKSAPRVYSSLNTAPVLRDVNTFFNVFARPGALRVVVLVTHQLSDSIVDSVSAGETLRNNGVQIISIGYGPRRPISELVAITGVRNQVIETYSIYYVELTVDYVRREICTFTPPPTPAPTTAAPSVTTSSPPVTTSDDDDEVRGVV